MPDSQPKAPVQPESPILDPAWLEDVIVALERAFPDKPTPKQ